MHKDLVTLNELGFSVVAMTIIGLPFDTEESIMALADWVTQVSKYQTVNLLTPLPATSNWDSLPPLDENGDLLPEGKMRPYHLYTGRQFVHWDERWSMAESRELFDRYSAKLVPVDDLYRRIFRILRTYRLRLGHHQQATWATASAPGWPTPRKTFAIGPTRYLWRAWSSGIALSQRVGELADKLRSVSQPLANARREVVDNIGTKITELTDSLVALSTPVNAGSKELEAT